VCRLEFTVSRGTVGFHPVQVPTCRYPPTSNQEMNHSLDFSTNSSITLDDDTVQLSKLSMLKSVFKLLLIASASSFAPHPNHDGRFDVASSLQATASRREVVALGFSTAAGVLSTILVVPTSKASAASAGDNVPTKEDLERLKIGHAQVVYLLDNFEKETTGEFILVTDVNMFSE
jgi:hypothetical protein